MKTEDNKMYATAVCGFNCQSTSTRKQRNDLFALRVELQPVTYYRTSELASLISTPSHL